MGFVIRQTGSVRRPDLRIAVADGADPVAFWRGLVIGFCSGLAIAYGFASGLAGSLL